MSTELAVAIGVALVTLWACRLIWHGRPVPVPSHSPEYDWLHNSHEWRVVINRQVYERSGGRCEGRGRFGRRCRARRGLQKHLLEYDCLAEKRWPRLDEIEHLCPHHHHLADSRRRSRERTRREQRRQRKLSAR